MKTILDILKRLGVGTRASISRSIHMSLYPSEVEAQHSSPDRITLRRLGESLTQH